MILLAGSLAANAGGEDGELSIKSGFITGQQFLDMSSQDQNSYAMGVVDGMFLAPFFQGQRGQQAWLERCVTGMSADQIATILQLKLWQTPESWHYSAHTSLYNALIRACK